MNNTVLVTGGNGFVGSHVCRTLVQSGYRVRALVYPGTSLAPLQGLSIDVAEGDITRPETLTAPLVNATHVVHLAAKVSDWGPDAAFQKSIVEGTDNVVRAAVAAGVARFVHMSSVSVHRYRGHSDSDENTALDGDINAYARTKVAAEKLLHGYHKQLGIAIVRPGLMPYGPGDLHAFPQLAQTIEKKIFRLIDQGQHRFGVSYVDNLVDGIALCLSHPAAANETFVIADDDILTWKKLADDIAEGLGCARITASVPSSLAKLGGVACETLANLGLLKSPPLTRYRIATVSSDIVFRNDKAKRLLGYKPRVDWKTGITNTIEWYRRNTSTA